MATIPKKLKPNPKDAAGVAVGVAEKEVALLLSQAGQDPNAVSPFATGGMLLLPPGVGVQPPSSSSSSSSPSSTGSTARIFTDTAQRADEMKALKRKLQQLEDQARAASAVSSAAAMAPLQPMAVVNAVLLDYIKGVEANRVKEAEVASMAREVARKEEVKSFEALSKKLTKKDDKTKFNLKQTTILLGTGEALQTIAEGCLFGLSLLCLFVHSLVMYTIWIVLLRDWRLFSSEMAFTCAHASYIGT
jgi:hypothetical protein